MTTLLTWLLIATAPLSPNNPFPDPPYPSPTLLPNYITQGDGTRRTCTPSQSYCWPDTSGLPSYLTGA